MQDDKRSQYLYEVLRARLEIREFFLKSVVREVYDNVGQVLSLVRMQLSLSGTQEKEMQPENAILLGDLVGQSIRDLRNMSKNLYPDVDLLKEAGWADALEHTLFTLKLSSDIKVDINGEPQNIVPGLKLIVFRMLQEILTKIKSSEGEFVRINTLYLIGKVRSVIDYRGTPINFDDTRDVAETGIDAGNLDLRKRVKLIDGKLTLKEMKNGIHRITLETPINLSQHD